MSVFGTLGGTAETDRGCVGDHADPTADTYARIASLLRSCDFLLVASGAGMSADSGLPTYDQIADVPAYAERGVSYADLCQPALLRSDAGLWYGFWGGCFDLYADTPPHDGYQVVEELMASCCNRASKAGMMPPCYVYTSNVDGHHRTGAGRAGNVPVLEIHGCVQEWLAADSDQCEVEDTMQRLVYTPPAGFRFNVDPETRIASDVSHEDSSSTVTWSSHPFICTENNLGSSQRIPLRPAVVMFGDNELDACVPGLAHRMDSYQDWEASMEQQVNGQGKRLVILELGCGVNVPSVRAECEDVLQSCAVNSSTTSANGDPVDKEMQYESEDTNPFDASDALDDIDRKLQALRGRDENGFFSGNDAESSDATNAGVRATLVRINRDFPLNPRTTQGAETISIRERCSVALAAISNALRQLAASSSSQAELKGNWPELPPMD